jgi:hypothetical protein
MRAGFPTRTRRCMSSDEGYSCQEREECTYREREIASSKL